MTKQEFSPLISRKTYEIIIFEKSEEISVFLYSRVNFLGTAMASEKCYLLILDEKIDFFHILKNVQFSFLFQRL